MDVVSSRIGDGMGLLCEKIEEFDDGGAGETSDGCVRGEGFPGKKGWMGVGMRLEERAGLPVGLMG
jgi:hypothetical protein